MAQVLTSRAVRTALSRARFPGNRVRNGYQLGGFVVSEPGPSDFVRVTHRVADSETNPAECRKDMIAQYQRALELSGYAVVQGAAGVLRVSLGEDMRCA